jgi:hypothetical protein
VRCPADGSAAQALCDVLAKNGVKTCSTFLLLHLALRKAPAVLRQGLGAIEDVQ